jgi:homoserine O-acetyltransferase/O-succinyltransferase
MERGPEYPIAGTGRIKSCESARPLTPLSAHKTDPTPHIVSAATHSRLSGRTGVNLGRREGSIFGAATQIAGAARTGLFNRVFLAGIRSAIVSDPDWNEGFYGDTPPIRGVRQFARVYAGWGFSEPFYRQQVFKTAFGAPSIEEFIETFWEAFFVKCDANNLLAQIWTWEHNDISAHARFGGDLVKALSSIKARTILMPSATDTYFPPIDNETEAKHIPHAELRPIPTIWGHMSPMNPEDQPFIDRALADALQ